MNQHLMIQLLKYADYNPRDMLLHNSSTYRDLIIIYKYMIASPVPMIRTKQLAKRCSFTHTIGLPHFDFSLCAARSLSLMS